MKGRFLIGDAALLGTDGHTAWVHGFCDLGTAVRTIDLRTGLVSGRPYDGPGFSEDWYAKPTAEGWLYRGASDLVLLSQRGMLHSFGPADTADVTSGRVLVRHASQATIFDLVSRVQLLTVDLPTPCLTVLLDDLLIVIEEGQRSEFGMDGALTRQMPNDKGSRVFNTSTGSVESTVSYSGSGIVTTLSGAVSAQVSGIVWDLAVGSRGFVATMISKGQNVLFHVDGQEYRASLPREARPRLFANGDALLATSGGQALFFSEGTLRRLSAPEGMQMSGALYEGKPIFVIQDQLVMEGDPVFPTPTADVRATIRREEWGSFACPENSDAYPIVTLRNEAPDGDRLTMHMAEVAFGWAMVGWTAGKRSWHLEPVAILEGAAFWALDHLNVVDSWVRIRVADAAWAALMRQAQTQQGRDALARLGIQLDGSIENPFLDDPAMIPFARDETQILHLAHHAGRLGVAGFDLAEMRMHWRADSLGDLMTGTAPGSPPAWFRHTYVERTLDRIEVQLIDERERYQRARLNTPVGHLEWAVPEQPFDRRVLEVLARLTVVPGLRRTKATLHRLIEDLGFREEVLRAGLEVNTNQTRWSHPDIVVVANTHGLARGPDNEVGVFLLQDQAQVWWGPCEVFFAGLPGSLAHPGSPEPTWFSDKMALLEKER